MYRRRALADRNSGEVVSVRRHPPATAGFSCVPSVLPTHSRRGDRPQMRLSRYPAASTASLSRHDRRSSRRLRAVLLQPHRSPPRRVDARLHRRSREDGRAAACAQRRLSASRHARACSNGRSSRGPSHLYVGIEASGGVRTRTRRGPRAHVAPRFAFAEPRPGAASLGASAACAASSVVRRARDRRPRRGDAVPGAARRGRVARFGSAHRRRARGRTRRTLPASAAEIRGAPRASRRACRVGSRICAGIKRRQRRATAPSGRSRRTSCGIPTRCGRRWSGFSVRTNDETQEELGPRGRDDGRRAGSS
jgi:hypothetical protein